MLPKELVEIIDVPTQKTLKHCIEDLVNGEREVIDVIAMAPSLVVEFLEDAGFEDMGMTESNGWQHDFWMRFERDGVQIQYSGCWYYRSAKLTIYKEE